MRYVISRYAQEFNDLAYRIYITDSLYAMGQGKHLASRFADTLKPQEQESRSADEIALDIIRKAGLKVGETQ